MALEIVDGCTGQKHISSEDLAALNEGLYGSPDVVFPYAQKFKLTMQTANSGTIGTGAGMVAGKRFWGKNPTQVSFETGSAGRKRNDLVVARYQSSGGIESVQPIVIKGTPAASNQQDPAITANDLKLWRVTFDGVKVTDPVQLFTPAKSLSELATATEQTKWSEVWVTGDGRIDARVCRVGDIVYFLASCYDGFSVSTDLNNPASFTTLPTWARPKHVWRAPIMYISDNQMAYAIFKPDGLVQLAGFSDSRYWYICTSYPAI